MKIIEEARSWIGTKYIKDASCKNVGCDCIGLIAGIYKNTLKNPSNKKNLNFFSPDEPHKTRNLKLIRKKSKKNAQKGVPWIFHKWYNANRDHEHLLEDLYFATHKVEQISNATIGVFVFDLTQAHIGLIAKNNNRLTLIHAHEASGKVVEHRLYGEMLSKLKYIYKFNEV